MGRRQSPLDGNNRSQRFAIGLRGVRAGSGMTIRALARRSGYSPSTLSQAESGRKVPTWDVACAFVQACGQDPRAWRDQWEAAVEHPSLVDAVSPEPSPHQAGAPEVGLPEEQAAAAAPGERRVPGARRPSRRSLPPAVGIGVLLLTGLLSGAGAAAWLRSDGNGTAAGPRPKAKQSSAGVALRAVDDGADPVQAGCAPGATTLDEQQVRTASGRVLGLVQLRYSQACDGAWARFHPAKAFDPRVPAMITVTVSRPADGYQAEFTYGFDGRDVYTDLLLFSRHCLAARAVVAMPGQPRASAATKCVTSP